MFPFVALFGLVWRLGGPAALAHRGDVASPALLGDEAHQLDGFGGIEQYRMGLEASSLLTCADMTQIITNGGVGEIERGGVFQSQQDVELSSHVGCTGNPCAIYVFRTDSGVPHEAIGGLHVSGRAGRLHNGLSYILSQGGGDPNQTASPTRIIQLGMCKECVSPKVGREFR